MLSNLLRPAWGSPRSVQRRCPEACACGQVAERLASLFKDLSGSRRCGAIEAWSKGFMNVAIGGGAADMAETLSTHCSLGPIQIGLISIAQCISRRSELEETTASSIILPATLPRHVIAIAASRSGAAWASVQLPLRWRLHDQRPCHHCAPGRRPGAGCRCCRRRCPLPPLLPHQLLAAPLPAVLTAA